MDAVSASAVVGLMFIALMIGFVAAAEVSLSSTSRRQIRERLDSEAERTQIVYRLLEDPARFLSSLMLVKTFSYVVAGAVSLWLGLQLGESGISPIFVVGATWLLLITVQILCRGLALRTPGRFASALSREVDLLARIFAPIAIPLRRLGARTHDLEDGIRSENVFLSEEGLRFLIDVGEGEGLIQEGEKQMIAGIIELGETAVREIMVPRLDIIAISVDSSLHDALDVIIERGHSRIPVFEENIDQIIGFLYAKDLLSCFQNGTTDTPLRPLLRKAHFIPQSKKLDELFREMQLRQVHIAVVVDEYGGTSGLVTIEDLLEEIVGEIQDEYDSEVALVQQLGPRIYLFNARLDLDDVSELIGVDLTAEHESVDTLGGFMYLQLGHVPEQSEIVEYGGWRFTVLSVEARRIEQIRVEPSQTQQRLPSEENDESDVSSTEASKNPGALGSAA